MSVLIDHSTRASSNPIASILVILVGSRDFKYSLQYPEYNTCLITEGGAP